MPCRRGLMGRKFKSRRWAKRFAGKHRSVKKIRGGYKIVRKRRSGN